MKSFVNLKSIEMKKIVIKSFSYIPVITCLLLVASGCQKTYEKPANEISARATETDGSAAKNKDPKSLKDFVQVNLVGDNNEYSPAHIDANLVNGWGVTFPTSGPAWVSAEATGKSTVYSGDGVAAGISPVSIPGAGTSTAGHPTGIVFNSSSDFKLPNGNPARFIFASADGTISGWNGGATAVKKIDDSPNAAYLGIAIASDAGNNYLYAANFAEGKIDVYDKNWAEVSRPFTDPGLPAGYSPFNIQNIDGKLYVMYAKVDPEEHEEETGPGLGYVDIYNPDGSLVKRFISRGQLNAPWGIAKAPAGFWGEDSDIQNVILVGNFGDGRINAFDADGSFLGQLRAHGNPIVIDGLWGISFAPATSTVINHNWLYFAAGPDDEEHGLFGYIKK